MFKKIDVESYLRDVLGVNCRRVSNDELLAKCPSPQHNDNNASWYCNINTGLHKCHSCGFTGNLEWLTKILLGHHSGTKIIRQHLGIEGHEDEYLQSRIKSLTEHDKHHDSEFDLSSYNYYMEIFNREILLQKDVGSKIKNFITTPLIEKYNLKHWTNHDQYYNSICFPIYDFSGQIININFRKIDKDSKIKYMCLPVKSSKNKLSDCVFFDNKTFQHFSKSSHKIPYIFVTEGCFDSIKLGENGLNSCTIFSNNISYKQLEIISKITYNPIFLLDSDKQGIIGQNNSYLFSKNFINFYSIKYFESNKDPDEYDTQWLENELKKILDSV